MSIRKLSQENTQEIKNLYESGVRTASIANKFQVNPCTVLRHLRAMGIKTNRSPSQETLDEVERLYRAGIGIKTIRKKLDIGEMVAHGYLSKLGIMRSWKEAGRLRKGKHRLPRKLSPEVLEVLRNCMNLELGQQV